MRRLPSLGPRGEGWLAAQLFLILVVAKAPEIDPWRPTLAGETATLLGLVGSIMSTLGVAIAIGAALQLVRRRSFSALPQPRDDGGLVDTGLYARVRHPIYSGIVLGGLGWAIARGSPLALAIDVALVAILYLKAAREEELLIGHYPAYEAYRARTKRLIPRVL